MPTWTQDCTCNPKLVGVGHVAEWQHGGSRPGIHQGHACQDIINPVKSLE